MSLEPMPTKTVGGDLAENNVEVLETWQLENGYSIVRVSLLPEQLYLAQIEEYLLRDFPVLPWKSELSVEDGAKLKRLQALLKNRYQIRLALLHEGSMVGWSYGWQDSVHVGDFYMAASLVLPEHRQKGLYTELVNKMIEISRDEGFTAVRSRHICTNNAVLIAKLKIGFLIYGFEQDESVGTLVKMIFHHLPLRKKAALFRSGKVSDQEVLERLLPSPKPISTISNSTNSGLVSPAT